MQLSELSGDDVWTALSPSRFVNVGVACHITSASPGGPRYNPALQPDQRTAIENRIWLCQTHSKLVDNDTQRFTVEELRACKQTAEQMIQRELEAITPQSRGVFATVDD